MIPVIIPFYKNKDQLDQCLFHLKKQTMPVEVFIRDNSKDNIYFTAAVNDGPLENFKDSQPICWANGACMILRKTMIQEIGLLDKDLVFKGS